MSGVTEVRETPSMTEMDREPSSKITETIEKPSSAVSGGESLFPAAAAVVVGAALAAAYQGTTLQAAEMILPVPYQLLEQGVFLGAGAGLGAIPTVALLWLARGDRC